MTYTIANETGSFRIPDVERLAQQLKTLPGIQHLQVYFGEITSITCWPGLIGIDDIAFNKDGNFDHTSPTSLTNVSLAYNLLLRGLPIPIASDTSAVQIAKALLIAGSRTTIPEVTGNIDMNELNLDPDYRRVTAHVVSHMLTEMREKAHEMQVDTPIDEAGEYILQWMQEVEAPAEVIVA